MTRTFDLTRSVPSGTESATMQVDTWAQLQAELHRYCPADVAGGLDLAWIRPTPLTRGDWTIQERAA
ncbi:hypothetical protein [Deinococcus soli (ex Cha et al. 2016)]|uniref:Uncharacterized protein n=2 Tax=Deinococcus soli (ex Cha et al. 2016) TaxID=1309411 RepID=A0ACC6KKI3_9DEIO|nr:hypothetical protein [Deinococcus soli (ex Cha et al. 2016)]MDR6218598.1 hypothetical protein [Deinococcus soli (ex Cha et al. 2016)]MDR6328395.1 hypothetical protein [Deinococcus soli (ex Cha et al. 2016)]MDR6753006.1 hypothetical protein [Deinococcus soli (ex Cha et al. 2016)]